jgi:hypothetical protein
MNNKKLLENSLKILKSQSNYDKDFSHHMNFLFPNAFEANLLPTNYLYELVFNLLEYIFQDYDKWIEYFVYELNFGQKNITGELKIFDKNKKEIPLSTIDDLYNFLIKNKQNHFKNGVSLRFTPKMENLFKNKNIKMHKNE